MSKGSAVGERDSTPGRLLLLSIIVSYVIENNCRLFLYSTTNIDGLLPFGCHRHCCPHDKCASILLFPYLITFKANFLLFWVKRTNEIGQCHPGPILIEVAFLGDRVVSLDPCRFFPSSSFDVAQSFDFHQKKKKLKTSTTG